MRAILPVFLCCAAAAAQCPYSAVSAQAYGAGCGSVFGVPRSLSVALDASACTLDVTVTAFGGCCNTFLAMRALAIGFAPANVALPQVDPLCVLLASPDALELRPNTAPPVFRLAIPSAPLPPITLYAQGAAFYVTFGTSFDAMLTAGSQISLR